MMETAKRVSITLNDPENAGSASNLANEGTDAHHSVASTCYILTDNV